MLPSARFDLQYYLPASLSFVVRCIWLQKCSYSPLDGACVDFIACMCLVKAPTMAAIRSKAITLMWPFGKLKKSEREGNITFATILCKTVSNLCDECQRERDRCGGHMHMYNGCHGR